MTGHKEEAMDVSPTELKRIAEKRNERDAASPGVIESAFGLLEILCALGRARVTDLAEESGLPRTTVYRLLGQLAAVGAVERVGAHYRLGAGLLVLGQHVTPMERLRSLAQRPLIELAAATPALVYLGVATSDAPIYLDIFSGRKRLPFQLAAGEPMPSRSAGARALAADVDFAVDDGDMITGVSLRGPGHSVGRRGRRGRRRRRTPRAVAALSARTSAGHRTSHQVPCLPL